MKSTVQTSKNVSKKAAPKGATRAVAPRVSTKAKGERSARPALEIALPEVQAPTQVSDSWGFYERLHMGLLLLEKCELEEAERVFEDIVQDAEKVHDRDALIEAYIGLLRLASESGSKETISTIGKTLNRLAGAGDDPKGSVRQTEGTFPIFLWLARGVAAERSRQPRLAIRFCLKFLKESRGVEKPGGRYSRQTAEECQARAWLHIAAAFKDLGRQDRSERIANLMLSRWTESSSSRIRSFLYHLLGRLEENRRNFDGALKWYNEAHIATLSEHNWYAYLYVLLSYAVIARKQRDYAQAYHHLYLLERAIGSSSFGNLRAEVGHEKKRLEQDAIDLLIDSQKGEVRTRESGSVSLRKQYILLGILEALHVAHLEAGEQGDGLSKAEIIRKVWGEDYRPEAHDNKLYYNINRLRKLIEPDMRKPRYLLNWREGYRLAPGLRVQFVGAREQGSVLKNLKKASLEGDQFSE